MARPAQRPVAPGALVGRDRELALAREALQGPGLLTVSGLGGIGKTALARAVASGSDAVFVELEHLPPDSPVTAAVLAAAGVPVRSDVDPVRVRRALEERRPLVVLDNAEHVRPAVRRLVVELAPVLPVLVTSRVPLDLPDEHVLELSGLEAAGAESAAVELFARRRRVVGHVGDAGDLDGVLELCRLVDGHPLALELAAAQSRVRRPAELVRLLREGRAPLTGSGRGRHDDLSAVLTTTLDLLDAEQRHLLRSAALFVTGARADALARVAARDDDGALAARLQGLLEAGLLRARVDDAGTVLELHPLVREHLSRAGLDDLRLAHAEWVFDTAPALHVPLVSPAVAALARQLGREVVPAAAALRAAGRGEDAARALVLVADAVAAVVSLEDIARAAAELRPDVEGPLAAHLGFVALQASVRAGDLTIDDAIAEVQEAAQAAGEVALCTSLLATLARREREAGRLDAAGRLLDEAAAQLPDVPERGLVAELDAVSQRAYAAVERAALLRAQGAPPDDVVAVLRAGDDPALQPKAASSLRTRLGIALADAGAVEEGRRLLRGMVGSVWPDMHVHQWLGWALLREPADLEGAERHLQRSAQVYEDQGWAAWALSAELGLAVVRLRRGDAEAALGRADELLARPHVAAAWSTVVRLCRAQALRLRGDLEAAGVEIERVLADPTAPPVVRTGATGERALVAAARGDDASARRDATDAAAGGVAGQPEHLTVGLMHAAQWRALAAPPVPLTPRQLEALRAVADGQTVAAAARELGVTPKTLTKHLENAYAALGASSRLEALRLAGVLGAQV